MNISIFTTNPKGVYSGGRYLSMILAHALGRAGAKVTYFTNNLPMFNADFGCYEDVAPVEKIVDPDFELPEGHKADWVVIIPTGGFDDKFYSSALGAARQLGARVALLSFETPNWFNAVSPFARSPMPTQSWRQTVAQGGAIFTIAKAGIAPARQFFGADRSDLTFDFWHPPINDLQAANANPISDGRKRVVSFVRVQDAHKGALDLLQIDPKALSGHTLSLVFGRGPDADFIQALASRMGQSHGIEIEIFDRIEDSEKFDLLSSADLLLFPSYFEGYGYPPVEAAWMGVPAVAYDLPLLHETVPDSTTFVRPGDTEAFSAAIQAKLSAPVDKATVKAALAIAPDTLSAGRAFLASLQRAQSKVAPLPSGRIKPISANATPKPTVTPEATSYLAQVAGPVRFFNLKSKLEGARLTIAGELESPSQKTRLRFQFPFGTFPDVVVDKGANSFEVEGLVQAWQTDALSQRCQIRALDQDGTFLTKIEQSVDISPELLLTHAARFPGQMRLLSGQAPGLCVAAPSAELFKDLSLSLGLAAIAQSAREAGHKVSYVPTNEPISIPDQIETEFLPLFDQVLPPEGPSFSKTCQATLENGGVVVAPLELAQTWQSASEKKLNLYSVSLPGQSELAVLTTATLPKPDAQSGKSALSPRVLNEARRSRIEDPLTNVLLLTSHMPVSALDEPTKQALKALFQQIPKLRIVLPQRLAASGQDHQLLDPVWRVQTLSEKHLSDLCRKAENLACLSLDAQAPDPITASLLGEADAWIAAPGDDQDATKVTSQLKALLMPPPSKLDKFCAALLPNGAAPNPCIDLGAATKDGHPASALPRLDKINALIFSAPLTQDLPALLTGWGGLDEFGAQMQGNAGLVGFTTIFARTQSPPLLSILLRVKDHKDERIHISLNGTRLGTITPKKPGSTHYDLDVPPSAWNAAGRQHLTLQTAHDGNVALMSLALCDHAPQTPQLVAEPGPQAKVTTQQRTYFELGLDKNLRGLRLASGWHGHEPDGCWAYGDVASLDFDPPLTTATPAILTFEAMAFGFGTLNAQRLRLSLGADLYAQAALNANIWGSVSIAINARDMANGISALFLDCPDKAVPKTLGLNNDHRELGVKVASAQLIETQGPLPNTALRATGFDNDTLTLAAAPGVLRLVGEGPVPADAQFMIAGQTVLACPCKNGDGWDASLVLTEQALATDLTLFTLMPPDSGSPTPTLAAIEIWATEPDQVRDVTLTLCKADRPDDIRSGLPTIKDNPRIKFSFDISNWEADQHLLSHGWSGPESEWIWNDGLEAGTTFPDGIPGQPTLCVIVASALSPDPQNAQRQQLCFGSDDPFATLLYTSPEKHVAVVPLQTINASEDLLRFSMPDARPPAGSDPRKLSLRLSQLRYQPYQLLTEPVDIPLDWDRADRSTKSIALREISVHEIGSVLEVSGAGNPPFALWLKDELITAIHPQSTQDGLGWQACLFCHDRAKQAGPLTLHLTDQKSFPDAQLSANFKLGLDR